MATSCEELTHWKWLWCWDGLGAGGEGDDRGWDGWMASPTRWTWVWVNSGSCWWTGRPGVLQFMGSKRTGHDWETELNWWCFSANKLLVTKRVLYKLLQFRFFPTEHIWISKYLEMIQITNLISMFEFLQDPICKVCWKTTVGTGSPFLLLFLLSQDNSSCQWKYGHRNWVLTMSY